MFLDGIMWSTVGDYYCEQCKRTVLYCWQCMRTVLSELNTTLQLYSLLSYSLKLNDFNDYSSYESAIILNDTDENRSRWWNCRTNIHGNWGTNIVHLLKSVFCDWLTHDLCYCIILVTLVCHHMNTEILWNTAIHCNTVFNPNMKVDLWNCIAALIWKWNKWHTYVSNVLRLAPITEEMSTIHCTKVNNIVETVFRF